MLDRYRKAIQGIIAVGIALNADAAPMTIAEKLSDIMASKEQIRQAIELQGVAVPANTPLSQYSAKIRQISRTHPNLSSICSAITATSYLPYAKCGDHYEDGAKQIWEAKSCPLASGTKSVYGNSRCSNQNDPGHGFYTNPRTVSWEPTNNLGSGRYCWCQICTTNATPRTNCGAWAMFYDYGSASTCSSQCALVCVYDPFYYTYSTSQAVRFALCSVP